MENGTRCVYHPTPLQSPRHPTTTTEFLESLDTTQITCADLLLSFRPSLITTLSTDAAAVKEVPQSVFCCTKNGSKGSAKMAEEYNSHDIGSYDLFCDNKTVER